MKSTCMHFMIGLLAAAFLVALYHMLFVMPHMAMAVVDVPHVYQARKAAFAQGMINDPSERQRDRALAEGKAFAEKLPKALAELTAECRCLLVDKSVVIGSRFPLPDLTEQLKKKVE